MICLLSCVDICDAASQSDQEAAEAGKDCSEKLELCSATSVVSTMKPVDVTAAAESDIRIDISMEINDKVALVEGPGDMLICDSSFVKPVVFFVCNYVL